MFGAFQQPLSFSGYFFPGSYISVPTLWLVLLPGSKIIKMTYLLICLANKAEKT